MSNPAADTEAAPPPIAPPETWTGRLRQIGPGIIISGSIVGSGELIVTTQLGAKAGFTLLWLIVFSCFIKVFLQIEIGRYVVSSGDTALEAFDRMPGPRLLTSWLVWLWAIMALFSVFQLSGILQGLVEVFEAPGLRLSPWILYLLCVVLTAALLSSGRYRHVERTTTFMVFVFTAITVLAGILLQSSSDYSISPADVAEGLKFKMPPEGILTAFAAFGVTGVGATELIYYPYWCLEKGYARFAGTPDGSSEWLERARGWIRVMHLDAWISFCIYTVGTLAFYFLGAAVLHRQGQVPGNHNMHDALANMYTTAFGPGTGQWFYLVGAFAVLFSTFFVATASNCRLFADAFQVFRFVRYRTPGQRRRVVQVFCVTLPVFCWIVVAAYGEPVTLILSGAIAQAAMLPFIALAAVYLRYRRTDRSLARPSLADVFLWLGVVSLTALGIFQIVDRIGRFLEP